MPVDCWWRRPRRHTVEERLFFRTEPAMDARINQFLDAFRRAGEGPPLISPPSSGASPMPGRSARRGRRGPCLASSATTHGSSGVRVVAIRRGGVAREGHPMRAALYARVSTRDQQSLGLQVEMMTAYRNVRGWEAVRQVKDVGSGAKERSARDESTG
jgi:hypothetical protein